jgi:hypothetical protein
MKRSITDPGEAHAALSVVKITVLSRIEAFFRTRSSLRPSLSYKDHYILIGNQYINEQSDLSTGYANIKISNAKLKQNGSSESH